MDNGLGLSVIAVVFVNNIFVSNIVLTKFLGLCPFFGVSKTTRGAIGMGVAVTFVMTLASLATWTFFNYVLLPQELVNILTTPGYILIIASLVQLVEIIMKKKSESLYESLGKFLPLITTNCAILGTALLLTTNSVVPLSFVEVIIHSFTTGIGFTLALILMSGIRERLETSDLPKCFQGLPIALIIASLMALSFMGFAGMVG